ncbi:DNA repair protein [Streptococcus gallolyticus]
MGNSALFLISTIANLQNIRLVITISKIKKKNRLERGGVMLDSKQLRKLKRSDLFELLVEQAKEIETLQERVNELEDKLQRREINLSEAGSIAEAALAISKVFDEAQAAANVYLNNVKRLAGASEEDSEKS